MTVFDLPYDLGFLKAHMNVNLIDCSGAKMILSWKRMLLMEKGVDDGVSRVIEGVHLCQSHILDQLHHICAFLPRSSSYIEANLLSDLNVQIKLYN